MTKVELVFRGFTKLSDEERKKFIEKVKEFINKDSTEKREITASINKSLRIDPGPIGGGGCPCCGR